MSALKTRSRITDPAGGWGWVGFGMLASVVTAAFAWVVPQPAVTVVDYLLAALFLVPCAGLLFAWWRIGPRFPHPVVATVLWALPLLACPLLFSFDVNAYLTQGWMVLGGHDPYVMTLGEPQLPGITVGADWVDTTSVYPAGALLIFAAVFWASGGLPWLGILLFRLLHLACLLVVAWAVKRVAPRVGVPVNTALWAGIATPLLILQWIGGLHNDAVLVALIALAVLVATRGGWSGLLLGGALIGLSLTVKQSGAAAGLGIVALAWAASPGRDWWRLAGRAAAAGAVAVGPAAAGSGSAVDLADARVIGSGRLAEQGRGHLRRRDRAVRGVVVLLLEKELDRLRLLVVRHLQVLGAGRIPALAGRAPQGAGAQHRAAREDDGGGGDGAFLNTHDDPPVGPFNSIRPSPRQAPHPAAEGSRITGRGARITTRRRAISSPRARADRPRIRRAQRPRAGS